MRRREGFTLIELMIVIAIIAIIAAIAIPGLLQSQRAANERNASASLKTLATAETDFRSNDRDGNKINDFWTFDVAGLYMLRAGGATVPRIQLIDSSIAGADTFNVTLLYANAIRGIDYRTDGDDRPPVATKSGYWYYMLASDASEATPEAYKQDTDQSGKLAHHSTKFGVGAYPDSFSAGRAAFMINESATIIRFSLSTSIRSGSAVPPAAYPSGGGTGAPSTWDSWPSDTDMKKASKLD